MSEEGEWEPGQVTRRRRRTVGMTAGWISPCRRFAVHSWDGIPALVDGKPQADAYVLTHIRSGLCVATCVDPEVLLGIPERLADSTWAEDRPGARATEEWRSLYALFTEEPRLRFSHA